VHWRQDFELEVAVQKKQAELARHANADARTQMAESEFRRIREDLEERNAMLTTSLDEMRHAASLKAEELARALRGAYEERAELDRLRKEAETALEAERRAKEQLAARQAKDAEAAAAQLRKMLDAQRAQLDKERQVIQDELLTEIAELRAKLKEMQLRPSPSPVLVAPPPKKTALVEYDPNKSMAESLRDALKAKNMRVMDLFRDFDADGSGQIDKKEWKQAWARVGPDFPAEAVDASFDDFDPDRSGELEFSELEKMLKRPLAGFKKAGLKLAKVNAIASAATDDVHGEGRGDFSSNMKIKADDFFAADKDGNTELEFDEFCKMVRMRDPEESKEAAMNDDELSKLFKQLDLDSSGTVDLAEYVQWALQQALKESKGRVLELFNQWDDDKSGFIDCGEFHHALNGMGFTCSKKDAAKVFRALDPDNSGKLDYRELNAALRKIQRRAYNLGSSRTADGKKPSPRSGKPSPNVGGSKPPAAKKR